MRCSSIHSRRLRRIAAILIGLAVAVCWTTGGALPWFLALRDDDSPKRPLMIASIATVRSRAVRSSGGGRETPFLHRTVDSLIRASPPPDVLLIHVPITTAHSDANNPIALDVRQVTELERELTTMAAATGGGATRVCVRPYPPHWRASAKLAGALAWWGRRVVSRSSTWTPWGPAACGPEVGPDDVEWPGAHAVRDALTRSRSGGAALLATALLTTFDDDMVYQPTVLRPALRRRAVRASDEEGLVSVLDSKSAISHSGWRQRAGGVWGVYVRGACVDSYTVQSHRLAKAVEVTVLNGGAGLSFRPRVLLERSPVAPSLTFADVDALLDSLMFAADGNNSSAATKWAIEDASRRMDDVLASAVLQQAGVRRFVIPAPPYAIEHLGNDRSVVDADMARGFQQRSTLNNEALRAFRWDSLSEPGQPGLVWWGAAEMPPHLTWAAWVQLRVQRWWDSESLSGC